MSNLKGSPGSTSQSSRGASSSLEKFAQSLQAMRHGLLKGIPDPFGHWLRNATIRLIYAINLGRGRKVWVAGKYPLVVEWERLSVDFEQWEACFTAAFVETLTPRDIVFDIGASIGEWSALAAAIVGPERVHVFEPDLGSWWHIKRVFQLNSFEPPAGIVVGFASDSERNSGRLHVESGHRIWPDGGDEDARFRDLLSDHLIPCMTLDRYWERTGVAPTVLKIDVEGAEGRVLQGAKALLERVRPVVFLSLHPNLVGRYGDTADQILDTFDRSNYTCIILGTDHEEHWRCVPRGEHSK